jgi:anaerobic selenocysteine-containing dehydrogenase
MDELLDDGLNQSTHGVWNTNAICNLHLATGKICRPGSGPFSLTGQPNAMGGREMGYMGAGLPGQRSVASDDDRRFVENLWRVPAGTLRQETGSGTVDLFERMAAGDIKACWIICTNPVATVPNRQNVIAGLQAAELVIAQDAFLDTETNRYADILLPGALWAEGDGVMVNSERNLTLMRAAVAAPGDALPDWRIVAEVARAMGFGAAFDYASAADVFDEIVRFSNPATGYDLRGAMRRCATGRCNGRSHRRRARAASDPLSERRREPDAAAGGRRRRRAAHRVPDAVGPRALLRAAARRAGRAARRHLPDRAEHRPPAASVAHDDEDGQGRDAEQAEPASVRRTSSGRCARSASPRRTASRSARRAAARCCRPS